MFKKPNNPKGFTLMEMLIVVALITILVAIAIPVMSNALEKAREAADQANLRSAYTEVMTVALFGIDSAAEGVTVAADKSTVTKHVDAVQTAAGWVGTPDSLIIGDVEMKDASSTKGWTVTYTFATGKVTMQADE